MRRKDQDTDLPKGGYPVKPWDERPISLERWRRHRDVLMADEARQAHRPPEWWTYDRGLTPPPREDEAEALLKMGELTDAELAEMTAYWREHYDQAQEPGFTFCTEGRGWEQIDGKWVFDNHPPVLHGAQARRAFYRWAGIPRAIVRQFDADRSHPRSR